MDIHIDRYKIVLSVDSGIKHEIIQAIRRFVNKGKLSEYSKSHDYNFWLKRNEKIIDGKEIDCYEVDSKLDLEKELKLNSNSLIFRYLETIVQTIELEENIYSVNLLLKSICDDFIGRKAIDDEIELVAEASEFTYKTLLKLLEVKIQKKFTVINEYDLSEQDIIKLQLNLINQISKVYGEKQFICFVYLLKFTKQIHDLIKEMNENVEIVVFCDRLSKSLPINHNNIAIIDKKPIDLSNEEDIYELVMDCNKNISIDEYKNNLFKNILEHFREVTINYKEL